jgi:hypothetical protein
MPEWEDVTVNELLRIKELSNRLPLPRYNLLSSKAGTALEIAENVSSILAGSRESSRLQVEQVTG